ncbi:MAG: hypothetical protein KIT81_09655 [Alphaproteobacteria bacterium]|nr:hypothetical protein [Alphaproteobacteria bacterium]
MIGRLFASLRDAVSPPAISGAGDLARFLEEKAAYLAQKCAVDYCRAKAGNFGEKLFREAPFQEALAVCRWESYAAAAADLLLVTEAALRPHLGADATQAYDRLEAIFRQILGAYPVPGHRPQGWGDEFAAFPARLQAARMAPPLTPAQIAAHTARRLHETIPIHESLRTEEDQEFIHGAVRFRMTAIWDEMSWRIRWPELARDLCRVPADPAPA